eukprot:gene23871-25455_t
MLGRDFRHEIPSNPAISIGQKLATSEAFRTLFREGMMLVEATAAYLDGAGREESRALPRSEALAYASESMRLTTRLMQLASWLLLPRAVNEGEMTQDQAATEKHKVKLSRQEIASNPDMFHRLPNRIQELCNASLRLQDRVLKLDRMLYADPVPVVAAKPAAIESQLAQLRAAFDVRH